MWKNSVYMCSKMYKKCVLVLKFSTLVLLFIAYLWNNSINYELLSTLLFTMIFCFLYLIHLKFYTFSTIPTNTTKYIIKKGKI